MRGLVGAASVFTVLGWFSVQASEMVGRMQDRVHVIESAATVRDASVGLEAPRLLSSGPHRTDWKALLGRDDDMPSGVKQRAVWKEQTRKLLAGEPPTAAEARRHK